MGFIDFLESRGFNMDMTRALAGQPVATPAAPSAPVPVTSNPIAPAPPPLPQAPPPRPQVPALMLPDTVYDFDMPMPAPALLPQAPPSRPANPNAQTTQNRRDRVGMAMPPLPPMPERPDMSIPAGQQLMRVGGAILDGAQRGGLAAMSQGQKALAGIQDYERTDELAQYQQAVENRNVLAKAQAEAQKAALDRKNKLDVQLLKNQKSDKAANKMPMQSPYMPIVLDSIDTAINMVTAQDIPFFPFDNVAGFFGDKMTGVAGSRAADLNNTIETIVSSIGFDRLQRMRDESPTGGALGQVSERELSQLNASLGSLKQSQSKERLLANLRRVQQHYRGAVKAIYDQQVEYAKRNNLPAPERPVGLSGQPLMGGGSSNYDYSAADAIVG